MNISAVRIEKPAEVNFILGHAHFIKTVEDLYETIVQTNPSMKFGIAFCEASGPSLVRYVGNDHALIELARKKIHANVTKAYTNACLTTFGVRSIQKAVPSNSRVSTLPNACSAPQMKNIQVAPCQIPEISMVRHMLR